jgi:hypothetical protein
MRRAGLILIAVFALAGCASQMWPSGVGTAPGETRVGSAGVTVAVPPGWSSAPGPPTSVSDPVERIAVASAPAPINPERAKCETEASERSLPPTAAMVIILEYTTDIGGPLGSYAPRPSRFGPHTPAAIGGRTPAPAFECFDGPGWTFQFTDHERRFLVWVLLGPKAGANVEAQALTALDSLSVDGTDVP